MAYGIGRIPADSDDEYQAAKAKIEYLDREGKLPPEPEQDDRYRICKRCGQDGYAGSYPFSTLYSPHTRCICDDCL